MTSVGDVFSQLCYELVVSSVVQSSVELYDKFSTQTDVNNNITIYVLLRNRCLLEFCKYIAGSGVVNL